MKKIIVSSIICMVIILASFNTLDDKRFELKTIVIDAGHGGTDPGCMGKVAHEADVALAVSLELGEILKEYLPDVKVVYTRNTDVFVKLNDRATKANTNGADLFVSIHCNSGQAAAYGTETYTMGLHNSTGTSGNLDEVAKRENSVIMLEDDYEETYAGFDAEKGFDPNSPMTKILLATYQQAYNENSIKLAYNIETQFKKRVGRNSRGVKQKGLWVLWKSYMPSVLIELGFLTNPNEEKFLNNKVNQSYMASAIFRAIRDYKVELEKQSND